MEYKDYYHFLMNTYQSHILINEIQHSLNLAELTILIFSFFSFNWTKSFLDVIIIFVSTEKWSLLLVLSGEQLSKYFWWEIPFWKMNCLEVPLAWVCTCKPSKWWDCSRPDRCRWEERRQRWEPWWRSSSHWDCCRRRQYSSRTRSARSGPSPGLELEMKIKSYSRSTFYCVGMNVGM